MYQDSQYAAVDCPNKTNNYAREIGYQGELKISKTDVTLQLHGAIYHPDSFVLMLRYCANLKAIRYEPTSLNRIVADKSQRVIVA